MVLDLVSIVLTIIGTHYCGALIVCVKTNAVYFAFSRKKVYL